MIIRTIGAISTIALLSACGGNGGSSFSTPDATGDFPGTLNNEYQDGIFQSDGEGIAYRLGSRANVGFQSEAGLIPGTEVAAFTGGDGTVEYVGRFEAGRWVDITVLGDSVRANRILDGGGVTFVADLDDGSFTGGTSSSILVVEGTLNGTELDGSVTYRGMTGTLTGLAGSDEAFGAFRGETDDANFAGGFVATATTP